MIFNNCTARTVVVFSLHDCLFIIDWKYKSFCITNLVLFASIIFLKVEWIKNSIFLLSLFCQCYLWLNRFCWRRFFLDLKNFSNFFLLFLRSSARLLALDFFIITRFLLLCLFFLTCSSLLTCSQMVSFVSIRW